MRQYIKKITEKLLNRETVSYIIFGVLTTAVDYAAASLLFYRAGLSEVISNTIAWIAAVAFAYITNRLYVFRSNATGFRAIIIEIISFSGSRVITLVISDVFLYITSKIGMEFIFAKIIISVVVIILNYILSKLFIFKTNKNEGGSNEQQQI